LNDTLKMKLGLERLGYFKEPGPVFIPGGDDGLWQGMRDFQQDNGLKVDGLADPGGPTVKFMNAALKSAPAPEDLVAASPDINTISADAAASNRRTARSLAKSQDVGDVPASLVAALKSKSGKAKAAHAIAALLMASGVSGRRRMRMPAAL
jgi:peptidoglycan hydrolase-like protein with peptidoglycan-binding domain